MLTCLNKYANTYIHTNANKANMFSPNKPVWKYSFCDFIVCISYVQIHNSWFLEMVKLLHDNIGNVLGKCKLQYML